MNKECRGCFTRYLKHCCQRCSGVKTMSAVFAIDPSALERVFQAALGMTVKQYVDEHRKRELLRMLRWGGGRRYGYQFAHKLEFSSDLAFYKWVKRVFGVTFNELREKHRQD